MKKIQLMAMTIMMSLLMTTSIQAKKGGAFAAFSALVGTYVQGKALEEEQCRENLNILNNNYNILANNSNRGAYASKYAFTQDLTKLKQQGKELIDACSAMKMEDGKTVVQYVNYLLDTNFVISETKQQDTNYYLAYKEDTVNKYDSNENISDVPLIISAGNIKKDKAYHTCRYEVRQLMKSLEEFDGVQAKVISAKMRKKGNTSFIDCSFSGLVGKRGSLNFPIKRVSFKYKNKAYSFMIDGVKSTDWPVYIGIMHSAEPLPVPATNNTSSINSSIKSFLVSFYKVGEENPASKVLPYYANTVDRYFSMKNVNKNDILKDKARYYKRWVKRKYRLLNFEVVDTTSSSRANLHTVRATIEWKVTSAKGTVKRGQSTNTIELYEDSNGFVVTSIK